MRESGVFKFVSSVQFVPTKRVKLPHPGFHDEWRRIIQTIASGVSFIAVRQQTLSVDAGFLCDKADVFGATIKETPCMITLNSVRQHNCFVKQGSYIGYMFRLLISHLQAYSS